LTTRSLLLAKVLTFAEHAQTVLATWVHTNSTSDSSVSDLLLQHGLGIPPATHPLHSSFDGWDDEFFFKFKSVY